MEKERKDKGIEKEWKIDISNKKTKKWRGEEKDNQLTNFLSE